MSGIPVRCNSSVSYRYPGIPSFAMEACLVIASCALALGGTIEDLKEAARLYSAEVEYSDVNMDDVYFVFGEIDD